jgi:hypothetical protein
LSPIAMRRCRRHGQHGVLLCFGLIRQNVSARDRPPPLQRLAHSAGGRR